MTPPTLTTLTSTPTIGVLAPVGDPVSQPSVSSSDLNSSFEHHEHEAGSSQPGPAANQQDSASKFGDTSNTEVQTISGNNNARRAGGRTAEPDHNPSGQLFETALPPSSENQNRPDAGEHEEEDQADKLATTTTLAPAITARPTLSTGYMARFTMKGSGKQQQQMTADVKRIADQPAQGSY